MVRTNLELSFPDKNATDRRQIERLYYRHFCDLIVEGIKNFSISKQEVESRFFIENPEMVDQYLGSGRHVIITGGHYNNWELYALAMPLYHRFSGLAIYKKLHNRFLDEKLRSSREKYGLKMIPMKATTDYFNRDAKRPKYGFVFGADQSPRNGSNAYWMKFLNQDTALLFGAEKYAKEYDAPVVFGEITKVKRGYYSLKYQLITDHPKETPYGYITEGHTKILEGMIQRNPPFWLWSHKRWKHKKPVNAG